MKKRVEGIVESQTMPGGFERCSRMLQPTSPKQIRLVRKHLDKLQLAAYFISAAHAKYSRFYIATDTSIIEVLARWKTSIISAGVVYKLLSNAF